MSHGLSVYLSLGWLMEEKGIDTPLGRNGGGSKQGRSAIDR